MILSSWMTLDSLRHEKPQLWFDTLTPSLACIIARFNWLSRAEIRSPTIRLWTTKATICQQRLTFFPQFYEKKKTCFKLKNYLLRSSRVSNSLASPFVPFSPFFSGSCPRSSFSESVSVTVLGKNWQSIQGFSGIFIFFLLWSVIVWSSWCVPVPQLKLVILFVAPKFSSFAEGLLNVPVPGKVFQINTFRCYSICWNWFSDSFRNVPMSL